MIRLLVVGLACLLGHAAMAGGSDRVQLPAFTIDRTEVTIAQFSAFAAATGLVTAAEREGGGFEYVGGWVRRPGWTFRAPSGAPATLDSPAAHVSHAEAQAYCHWAGGRLPRAEEWRSAAYAEQRDNPTDGFERGRVYPYPVGDRPDGMNTSGDDPWPRHAPAGATRRGVNGLYDMGANLWEWLEDQRGTEALTAGGSWWYGAAQSRSEALQWKDRAFVAVYIGFRCVYPRS